MPVRKGLCGHAPSDHRAHIVELFENTEVIASFIYAIITLPKHRVIDERSVDSLFVCPLIFGAKLPWRFVLVCFRLFSIGGVVGYKYQPRTGFRVLAPSIG